MSHAVQAFTSTINIAHVVCPVTRRKTVFEQYVASSSPLPACPAAQTWPSDNDVIDSVLLAAVAAAPSFARRLVVNHKSTTKPANLQYQKRRIESIYSGALKLVALYLVFNVSHSIELSTAGQLSKKDIQAELQFQSCYPFSYAMYAATTALLLALWIPRSKNHHQQDSDTKQRLLIPSRPAKQMTLQ